MRARAARACAIVSAVDEEVLSDNAIPASSSFRLYADLSTLRLCNVWTRAHGVRTPVVSTSTRTSCTSGRSHPPARPHSRSAVPLFFRLPSTARSMLPAPWSTETSRKLFDRRYARVEGAERGRYSDRLAAGPRRPRPVNLSTRPPAAVGNALSARPSLRASVRPCVRPSVRASVRPSVRPSVHPSVRC